jgi:Zn-dependent peptidase ImmA (M78 family)
MSIVKKNKYLNLDNRVIDLFGSKYTIEFKEKIIVDNSDEMLYGMCDFSNNKVYIATKNNKDEDIPIEEIHLTIIHEIVHAILTTGKYNNASADEPLVEWIARCLYSLHKQIK